MHCSSLYRAKPLRSLHKSLDLFSPMTKMKMGMMSSMALRCSPGPTGSASKPSRVRCPVPSYMCEACQGVCKSCQHPRAVSIIPPPLSERPLDHTCLQYCVASSDNNSTVHCCARVRSSSGGNGRLFGSQTKNLDYRGFYSYRFLTLRVGIPGSTKGVPWFAYSWSADRPLAP